MKARLSDKSKEATVPNPARRRFLQTSVAGAGVLLAEPLLRNAAAAALVPLEMTNTGPDKVPRKPLGRTGAQVSILGIGGYHLGTVNSSDEGAKLVHEAIDSGINFFDNAWEYHEGGSEELMGRALEGRRDNVFLT